MVKRTFVIRGLSLCLLVILLCGLLSMAPPAQAANDLRVGVCADTPPFHFEEEGDRLTGLHIDLVDHIARAKNYAPQYQVFDRISGAVEALERGEVDVVLGALPSDVINNPNVRFTNSISSASVCMLAPNHKLEDVMYSQEEGRRYSVAFELGTITFSHLSQFYMVQSTVMGSQEQLYDALTAGRVDSVVCVKDSMLHILERDGIRDNYTIISEEITNVEYMLLVRTADRALYSILNDAIARLRTSNAYTQILDRWMVDLDLQDMQGRVRMLAVGALVVTLAAGIIIVNIRYINKRLKVLVAEKTYELNRQMRQLEAASNLRNRLVEHSPGGNMLVQRDGTVLLINPVARTMAGLGDEDAPLGNVRNMKVFGPIWEKAAPYFHKEMEAPELIVLSNGGRDKHTYRYQCHRTNTRSEMVLLVEDVTWEERRKQEAFEERKNLTLNRIIAGVAHEIKNPLMSIRTFSSLIVAQGNDPEFQTAFQEYVPKEVDRISKMIETLINYARPPREHKERIQASELVKDCMSLAYISAKKRILMEYNVPDDIYVYANGDQLRQALVNLLINGIEAVEAKMNVQGDQAPEDLRVQVFGFREGQNFVLEIHDQGLGMSEEDILQCTDPFFTTKKSGVGMGLALTKQYVRENDGTLEIESTLGQFTKMRMTFKEDTGYETDRMDH